MRGDPPGFRWARAWARHLDQLDLRQDPRRKELARLKRQIHAERERQRRICFWLRHLTGEDIFPDWSVWARRSNGGDQ